MARRGGDRRLLGLAAAVILYNSGQTFAGLMACALTALLVSPISWDHHWVWIAPGLALIIDAGVPRRGRGTGGVAGRSPPPCWSSTAPGRTSGPARPGLLQGGLINYAPASSFAPRDNPAYAEYHWHGLQLIAGNLYLLGGRGAVRPWAWWTALRAAPPPSPPPPDPPPPQKTARDARG